MISHWQSGYLRNYTDKLAIDIIRHVSGLETAHAAPYVYCIVVMEQSDACYGFYGHMK